MPRPKLTTEIAIERFKSFHGDKYDYSKAIYTGAKNKITVICRIHGEFNVILDKHVVGGNCPKCVNEQYHKQFRKTTNQFITMAKLVHGNKYDYTKVNYVNNKTKVIITCPKHGDFNQRPSSHIDGYGCSMCKESIGESQIRTILEDNNLLFNPQHRFIDCVKIKPLPFDFYLPSRNLCIEFNGKQHYEHNHFFVTEKGFEELKERDEIKSQYCKDNGIKLIVIKYDDIISDKLKLLIS